MVWDRWFGIGGYANVAVVEAIVRVVEAIVRVVEAIVRYRGCSAVVEAVVR